MKFIKKTIKTYFFVYKFLLKKTHFFIKKIRFKKTKVISSALILAMLIELSLPIFTGSLSPIKVSADFEETTNEQDFIYTTKKKDRFIAKFGDKKQRKSGIVRIENPENSEAIEIRFKKAKFPVNNSSNKNNDSQNTTNNTSIAPIDTPSITKESTPSSTPTIASPTATSAQNPTQIPTVTPSPKNIEITATPTVEITSTPTTQQTENPQLTPTPTDVSPTITPTPAVQSLNTLFNFVPKEILANEKTEYYSDLKETSAPESSPSGKSQKEWEKFIIEADTDLATSSSLVNKIASDFAKIKDDVLRIVGETRIDFRNGEEVIITPDVISGIDSLFSTTANGVKETIVIKDESHAYSSFNFELKSENLLSGITKEGNWIFFQKNGNGNIFESANLKAIDNSGNSTSNILLSIEKETNQPEGIYNLTITLDPTWLSDKSRSFPVTIEREIRKVEDLRLKEPQLLKTKNVYSSAENPSFFVSIPFEKNNIDINSIDTKIFTPDGKEKSLTAQKIENNIYSINIPQETKFKPGKQNIEVKIKNNEKEIILNQDFLWGVLAINPDKSIYSQNETSFLSMAVLNEQGKMQCDSKLLLNITSPDGEERLFSTEDKTITTSGECGNYDITKLPDFFTNYQTSKPGKYILELLAQNENGIHEIKDQFFVEENPDFDVKRNAHTRIYPIMNYPVKIEVAAKNNYKGEIIETLPETFIVESAGIENPKTGNAEAKILKENGELKIKWQVDLKEKEKVTLVYNFDAPDESPQFYLAGPLEIGTWKEKRNWQIASDAFTKRGMGAYQLSAQATIPKIMSWTGSAWNGASNGIGVTGTVQYIVVKANSQRDEIAIGTQDSNQDVRVQICNYAGTCSTIKTVTDSCGTNATRVFDIEVEKSSGDILVVYNDDVAQQIAYDRWTGSSWIGEQTLTIGTAAIKNSYWIELYSAYDATSPNPDNMMVVVETAVSSTYPDLYAAPWTGSSNSFGSAQSISTTLEAVTYIGFSGSYEDSSGDFVLYYNYYNDGTIRVIDYASGSWGVGSTGRTSASADIINFRSAVYPDTNRIMTCWNAISAVDFDCQEWDGTTMKTGKQIDGAVEALSAPTRAVDVAPVIGTNGFLAMYGDSNVNYFDFPQCTSLANCQAGTWSIRNPDTTDIGTDTRWGQLYADPAGTGDIIWWGISQTIASGWYKGRMTCDASGCTSAENANSVGATTAVNVEAAFFDFIQYAPTITVSGTVRDTGESTALTAASGTTVTIVAKGQSAQTTTVQADGTYTKSGITVNAAGDAVLVYLNDSVTYKGSAVTVANDTTSNIENMDIIQNRLIATSHKTGTSITNTNFGDVDQGDTDDLYSVSSSILTTNEGYEFHIASGKTFAPGNNVNINGSYHNPGTATWSTYTTTFGSTQTGNIISGYLSRSVGTTSPFYKVTFNGSGGSWTIQDPMVVDSNSTNATDTFNMVNGSVTLGDGTGDNLEVAGGRFTVGVGQTFATYASLAGGSNPESITIDINHNSSPDNYSNMYVDVNGVMNIYKNVTMRLNSSTAVQTGIGVSAPGQLNLLGTQDLSDTNKTSSTPDTKICASNTYTFTANQYTSEKLMMTSGLAKSRIYDITATTVSDGTCSGGSGSSITVADSYGTTDASPTVTDLNAGYSKTICSSSTALITTNNEGIGKYIRKVATNNYFLIVDSVNNDAGCASKDKFIIIGNPDDLSNIATNDDIKISDGMKNGDTYEILDYATIVGNSTHHGYISGSTQSEINIQNAEISELGDGNICDPGAGSLKCGITVASVNGFNTGQNFNISHSYLHDSYSGFFTYVTSDYNISNNYVYNMSDSFSRNMDTDTSFNNNISDNRFNTTGNAGFLFWRWKTGTIKNNIMERPASAYFLLLGNYSDNNVVYGNTFFIGNGTGIHLDGNVDGDSVVNNYVFHNTQGGSVIYNNSYNHRYAGNHFFNDLSAIRMGAAASYTLHYLVDEYYGVEMTNTDNDLLFSDSYARFLAFNSLMSSTTKISAPSVSGPFIFSRKHDQTAGLTKIWEDYVIPSANSETPQEEEVNQFNYADSLYPDSITPHKYMGGVGTTGTEDTNLSFSFNGTMGGDSGYYVYRVVCNALNCVTTGSSWDVYRNETLLTAKASTTSEYTDSQVDGSTAPNVKFTIGDAGTDYSWGDTYTFIAFKSSSDTNTQKTITMMQSNDSFTAEGGATVELLGGSSANQTLIQKNGALGYNFKINGGTINANYYKFTGLYSLGLNITSGTVTDLNNGTFDDSSTGGGPTDTYMTVAPGILNVSAKTWTGMVFDDGTVDTEAEFNAKLSSAASSCSNSWTFVSTGNLGGSVNGEANDSDPGDGTPSCNNSNGYLLWQDPSTGPTLDQIMRHGNWFDSSGVRQPMYFKRSS